MKKLNNSWLKILEKEFEKNYFKEIKKILETEKKTKKIIFPAEENIFSALNSTKFENIKVVLLWQDPYHGEWQAHWLSFSVAKWIKIPPSLRNIYKEIESDLGIKKDYENPNLESWAKQWVLLLNAVLTVEKWQPASHSKIGWQNFTDEIIKQISDKKENVVFLLWWAFAQWKKSLIDEKKHLILKTTHPSPFSAYRWFLGSKHFSKTNDYLEKNWKEKINW